MYDDRRFESTILMERHDFRIRIEIIHPRLILEHAFVIASRVFKYATPNIIYLTAPRRMHTSRAKKYYLLLQRNTRICFLLLLHL
jgi:hypothetical protein